MNQLSFLQSSEWENFQKNLGRRTWRVGNVLIVRHRIGRGGWNYLYAGRPALPEKIEPFLAEVKKIAQGEQSVFFRIDRAEPDGGAAERDVLARTGRTGHPMQPQRTVMLDLSKAQDALLSAMHEKTRYNIRLAEKKEVVIKKVLRRSAQEDFEIFWDLLQITSRRNKFHTHGRKHYEMLVETHSPYFSNELFFAEYKGKPIAVAMVNFYQPTFGLPGVATYVHGASSNEARSVMAPYALHWHIALEAKQRGFGWYDLWGIDDRKWPGLTRFKRGFGGDEIAYASPVEIMYRPFLAGLYRIVKWFR
ncbi:MAG: peptidoglycan bridge formation glycyltransferase FemA/FemB family protein [Candidatus Sungbacteria bacterium]|nr:peptidoglycan bridge formation glycyltransferase FemA/FemB family protein [Candidatus Sungbacteria bacterium]